ncbi:hypothetical protein WISP_01625 [Willisornis vidua]|uniref:Uncharacterized protein n=1 Tax=Willisornis vidua TaxID=1566151 RepID=A0ABQ9E075_9PASS|nr:hypothetical protein WISP_01625 [Willisornis vidua]
MDSIKEDKSVPRSRFLLLAVSLISLTDPCAIIIALNLISPSTQSAIPPPPPPSIPKKLSFRGNIWVELADLSNSNAVCLTNTNIDDPFKSHLVALPDSFKTNKFYNDPSFLLPANLEPQEIKILGSLKAGLCISYQKTSDIINNVLTPDAAFYHNASSWCIDPTSKPPMRSHRAKSPQSLPQGWFLVCGDRAWAGVPSLPVGGPCTIARLLLLDPATPTMPKRVNDDPDPENLKSTLVQLLEINSTADFTLLSQFGNLTLKGKSHWALAKCLDPVSIFLKNMSSDSRVSPSYRAAVEYFMLARSIGCNEKPGLCCFNFDDLQKKTQFAFYSVSELKNLFSAARVPNNFYSKDIFDSVQIPYLPNWLKQIVLVCLSSAFTYSLSFAKNLLIRRVFPASIQNKKGGDVGDGPVYETMDRWRSERDKKTDFNVWKAQKEDP